MSAQGIWVLAIGIEDFAKVSLLKCFADTQIVSIAYDLEEILGEAISPQPVLIVCGPPPAEIPLIEVAQALRMQYQDIPIHFVTCARVGFDRKLFQKNGFTDAFLFPLDMGVFESVAEELLAKASSGGFRSYRAVRLVDIEPGVVLDFDTYLHLKTNGKHVRYTAKGDPLDAERVERMKQHQLTTLEISRDQMPKFYDFTAMQLKALGNNQAISETEKRERMQSAIRDVVSGIFNDTSKDQSFEQGKLFAEDCQQIVKSYIVNGSAGKGGWYEKLLNAETGGGNGYSHSANVATFSALFSMALGIGDPETLAFASLLHDIGLADVPVEIQQKSASERTPAEQAVYEQHPEFSLRIIKNRKMVLTKEVEQIILQHHERPDGTGYPNRVSGSKLSKAAQLLAFADVFDDLLIGAGGKPRLTPSQAIRSIYESAASDPSRAIIDVGLISQLIKVFTPAA